MLTLFKARSVITMNPSQPRAEAVLVRDDRGRVLAHRIAAGQINQGQLELPGPGILVDHPRGGSDLAATLSQRFGSKWLIGKKLSSIRHSITQHHRYDTNADPDLLTRDAHELGNRLALAEDDLGHPLSERPVVVHRFPAQTKAFYMATDPERPELSLSADILAPEGYGEIVGGGQPGRSATNAPAER